MQLHSFPLSLSSIQVFLLTLPPPPPSDYCYLQSSLPPRHSSSSPRFFSLGRMANVSFDIGKLHSLQIPIIAVDSSPVNDPLDYPVKGESPAPPLPPGGASVTSKPATTRNVVRLSRISRQRTERNGMEWNGRSDGASQIGSMKARPREGTCIHLANANPISIGGAPTRGKSQFYDRFLAFCPREWTDDLWPFALFCVGFSLRCCSLPPWIFIPEPRDRRTWKGFSNTRP